MGLRPPSQPMVWAVQRIDSAISFAVSAAAIGFVVSVSPRDCDCRTLRFALFQCFLCRSDWVRGFCHIRGRFSATLQKSRFILVQRFAFAAIGFADPCIGQSCARGSCNASVFAVADSMDSSFSTLIGVGCIWCDVVSRDLGETGVGVGILSGGEFTADSRSSFLSN